MLTSVVDKGSAQVRTRATECCGRSKDRPSIYEEFKVRVEHHHDEEA